ncbi:MAG TPA: hypothetical protein VHU87_10300 [Rhizomicrobium sp.]|jgi:hypothetical protein|nr:hypothetical protein [Rhizomicrobium sp.]
MRRALVLLAVLAASPAQAGAWTENEGGAQVIIGATYSGAGTSFDSSGGKTKPAAFQKVWSSIWAEYGWTDDLTLILSPEYAWAKTRDASGFETRASDFAYGGGVRYRIADSFGTLSVQATVKSAGAFDMSVAVDKQSGEQAELRLLYGTNFSLFDRDGFIDVEAGERWIAGARPNETPIDITLGYHVLSDGMALVQSFNVIAGGDARPPYTYYRSHKLEFSWVSDLGHGVSMQSGTYFSPAGQNSLDELGAQVALWVKF